MIELPPNMCASGTMKSGPAAIPATADDIYKKPGAMSAKGSPFETIEGMSHRVCELPELLAVGPCLRAETELVRES